MSAGDVAQTGLHTILDGLPLRGRQGWKETKQKRAKLNKGEARCCSYEAEGGVTATTSCVTSLG